MSVILNNFLIKIKLSDPGQDLLVKIMYIFTFFQDLSEKEILDIDDCKDLMLKKS